MTDSKNTNEFPSADDAIAATLATDGEKNMAAAKNTTSATPAPKAESKPKAKPKAKTVSLTADELQNIINSAVTAAVAAAVPAKKAKAPKKAKKTKAEVRAERKEANRARGQEALAAACEVSGKTPDEVKEVFRAAYTAGNEAQRAASDRKEGVAAYKAAYNAVCVAELNGYQRYAA